MIQVIIILIVVGLLLYAVNKWLPIDEKIRLIINVVVVFVTIIWLLKVFGVFSMGNVSLH